MEVFVCCRIYENYPPKHIVDNNYVSNQLSILLVSDPSSQNHLIPIKAGPGETCEGAAAGNPNSVNIIPAKKYFVEETQHVHTALHCVH